jgi:hypothetical protein
MASDEEYWNHEPWKFKVSTGIATVSARLAENLTRRR